MKHMRITVTANRMIGTTVQNEEKGKKKGEPAEYTLPAGETEEEENDPIPVKRRSSCLLEMEPGEHPLGRNIIPRRVLPVPCAVDFSEASDIVCCVIRAAAREIGIAPETLNQRVRARLKADRRKRRSRIRLIEEDEEAWLDRI